MKKFNARMLTGISLMAVLVIGTSSALAASEPVKTQILPVHINSNFSVTTGGAITITPPTEEIPNDEELQGAIPPVQTTTGPAIQINFVSFTDRVYNTKTNEGIADVKVTAYNTKDEAVGEAITDANGYFTLEIPYGEYLLTFERNGFKPTQETIQINE